MGPSATFWLPVHAPVRKTERFMTYVRKNGFIDSWRARGWPDLCYLVGANDFACHQRACPSPIKMIIFRILEKGKPKTVQAPSRPHDADEMSVRGHGESKWAICSVALPFSLSESSSDR
jgi:hypothetical protein